MSLGVPAAEPGGHRCPASPLEWGSQGPEGILDAPGNLVQAAELSPVPQQCMGTLRNGQNSTQKAFLLPRKINAVHPSVCLPPKDLVSVFISECTGKEGFFVSRQPVDIRFTSTNSRETNAEGRHVSTGNPAASGSRSCFLATTTNPRVTDVPFAGTAFAETR